MSVTYPSNDSVQDKGGKSMNRKYFPQLMEDIVGEPVNQYITLRGWWVSLVICISIWTVSWMKVLDIVPLHWHMLMALPSGFLLFGMAAIVPVIIFGLFKRPWRAALKIAGISFLTAATIMMFIIFLAVVAAFEA